ncbi:hypothetical protein ACLOJK_007717 [Asimina triloba]
MEKNDGDRVTVGRRRTWSTDREGEIDADLFQQTEKEEEDGGGGRSGDGRPEAGDDGWDRVDWAQAMGRWLSRDDDSWDRVQEMQTMAGPRGDGTIAGDWLVTGGGGRFRKTGSQ